MTAIAITLFLGALFVVLIASILLREPRKLHERKWAKPAKKCGACDGRGSIRVHGETLPRHEAVCFECAGSGVEAPVDPTTLGLRMAERSERT